MPRMRAKMYRYAGPEVPSRSSIFIFPYFNKTAYSVNSKKPAPAVRCDVAPGGGFNFQPITEHECRHDSDTEFRYRGEVKSLLSQNSSRAEKFRGLVKRRTNVEEEILDCVA